MSTTDSPLTSSLAKARGLGAAKEGAHHWWVQRVSAILMFPLMLWFLYQVVFHFVGADQFAIAEWFTASHNAIGIVMLLTLMFYHARLGVQVIIEDYVHSKGLKIGALMLANLAVVVLIAVTWVSTITLHLQGL